ncbi:MAG: restriction endonuclease subunit S, partial [Paludibacteraceae bacterium]|nr:restriction endonuclease subunit S [Paludibacteraceae bacterium]
TLCNTYLPVPSIEEQRRIVTRYQAIQNRIENNKKTIAKLEEAAQALYRKMFVDGIDVERLPDGWRMGTLGEVCEIKNGKAIIADTSGKYYIYGGNGIVGKSNSSNAKDVVIIGRVGINCGSLNLNIGECWVNDNAMKAESGSIHYLYMLLKQLDLNSQSEGSGQPLLTQGILNAQEICIPNSQGIEKFEKMSRIIYDAIRIVQKENEKLMELLSLLMVGMGR